jgi:diguanylate cyclase (GGDEF)-like protein/PAS domain S-box-containing protein
LTSEIVEGPRLRAVLEYAGDVSMLCDNHLLVLWVSPALERLWGYDLHDVAGADFYRLLHPDDAGRLRGLADAVAGSAGLDRLEVRMRDSQGSWRWSELVVADQLEGDAAGLVVTVTDTTERRMAAEHFDRRERFYWSVLSSDSGLTLVCEADCNVTWASPSSSVLGYPAEALVGTNFTAFVRPLQRSSLREMADDVIGVPRSSARAELELQHADGSWRRVGVQVTNLLDEDPVNGLVINVREIMDRLQGDENRVDNEEFLRAVLDATHYGVWVFDSDGHTLLANRRMSELAGIPFEDIQRAILWDLLDDTAATEVRARLAKRAAGLAEEYELEIRRSDGERRWALISAAPLPARSGSEADYTGSVAVITDITERKTYEEALRRRALYDELTGLPNQALVTEQVHGLNQRAEQLAEHYSYLLCDIDNLKTINDAFGMTEGDRVISAVGSRLQAAARVGDFVARANTDRFVILCSNTASYQAKRIAEDLVSAIREPLVVSGSVLTPTICVGAASTSEVSPSALSAAADGALFSAKRQGPSSVVVFEPTTPIDRRATLDLIADLRGAAAAGTLRLHYQPIFKLATSEMVATEALMRWVRPGHGEVPPDLFIRLAEEAGIIHDLGAWSLRQACRDAASWQIPWEVGVNLSTRQLAEPHIVDTVRYALAASELAPERLTLEVTETALLTDTAAATARLEALAGLGVRIALDDFGTGYSSLSYIRDFPVNTIKIDRSFVAGLGRNPDDSAIVATLVNLATALNISVVAEGIETVEQVDVLRALGCQFGQGYLWTPPVPSAYLMETLAHIQRAHNAPDNPRLGGQRNPTEDIPDAIARRILEMHQSGISASAIAATLNTEEIPGPQGRRWHRNSVARAIARAHFGSAAF